MAALLLVISLPTPGHACGGPCTTPELWGVLPFNGAPLVVTNFGMLSPDDSAWRLTCEETIGGIVLGVRSNGTHAVISTDAGLFVAGVDTCKVEPGPKSPRSAWFLDVAVASAPALNTPPLLGLVSDPALSSINLERSTAGGDFELLRSLGTDTAYRRVEASSDFGSIVVAGYSAEPRQWQLAWSPDSGESWNEHVPSVDATTASIQLMALAPDDPDRVFFQVQATEDTGAELWSFQRGGEVTSRHLTLERGEAITGIAFLGAWAWLSSSTGSLGRLYRARLENLDDFERVIDDSPPLGCLGAVTDALYVCGADYSSQSPFLLGKVNIEALSVTAVLSTNELGALASCGSKCASTTSWLDELYGRGRDAGGQVTGETTDAQTSSPARSGDNGWCGVAAPSKPTGPVSISLLLALAAFRRRRVAQRQHPDLCVGNVNPGQVQRDAHSPAQPRPLA